MPKFYAEYQRFNPACPVDWRYRRVEELIRQDRRASPRDDHYVKEARAFIKRFRYFDDDLELDELFYENPGLWYAHELYQRRADDPYPATIIETRLLAGQSYDEIAHGLKTVPLTVEYYDKLFFDVADNRDHRDWIVSQVFVPAIWDRDHVLDTMPDADKVQVVMNPFFDPTVKIFAYWGGPVMADFFLLGIRPQAAHIDNYEQIPELIHEWFKDIIARRAVHAGTLFNVNRYTVTTLMDLYAKLQEIEKSTDQQQKNVLVTEFVKAAVARFHFKIGDREGDGTRDARHDALKAFDNAPGEVRDRDLIELARGNKTASADRVLSTIMPTPSKPTGRNGPSSS